MKNIAFIICMVLVGLVTQQVKSQEKSIDIPLSETGKRGALRVEVHRGTVTVKGTNREDVLVTYESLNKSSSQPKETKNGLKKINGGGIDLEIRENDNKVVVDVDHSSNPVALVIEVPIDFDLKIGTHHIGNVALENINGEIVVDAHHGGVSATDISGSLVANSWHGDIKVAFNEVANDIPMAFTTYHGDVELMLPSSAKADLKLRSDRGDIFSGFDVELKKQSINREKDEDGVYKVSVDEMITGTINGGGNSMSLQTHHGDIYVKKN
ncbi:MAG: DUF4097 family beta strand repeat-containing protein [Bacteroidota bacterium]